MKKFYRALLLIGITSAILFLFPAVVQAAASDLEAGGRHIHTVIVSVGKWVIIVKGTIDCIQSVLDGDIARAKRQFFGYLMCFGIMLALPWGLDELEGVFR